MDKHTLNFQVHKDFYENIILPSCEYIRQKKIKDNHGVSSRNITYKECYVNIFQEFYSNNKKEIDRANKS